MANWIYFSPHPDDVALSCGGLVWEQTTQGQPVSIWTVCAGDPPEGSLSEFAQVLHARWGTGPQAFEQRRQEDIRSCQRLAADYRHLAIPDCIYRRAPGSEVEFLYAGEERLSSPIHPAEAGLVEQLSAQFARWAPARARLVIPLALGGHVDHRLTRQAAEKLGRSTWYYADYPYVLRYPDYWKSLLQDGWKRRIFSVSEAGLDAWQESVAAHGSQISTFWLDLGAMRQAIQKYWENNRVKSGGIALWRPSV